MKPELFISDRWKDYELLDAGGGRRLERWGQVILDRPDPQALWSKVRPALWKKAEAVYHRSEKGGGGWEYKRELPESWTVSYGSLNFMVRPTGFKHTGLFPEQAYNWDRIINMIKGVKRPVRILNLFGYTGAATVAAASIGAEVCHVDASKGMLTWCRQNASLSRVKDGLVRYIPDDCLKFVKREVSRGNRYDAVIMDPPSFGRGAKGEVWKIEDDLMPLIDLTGQVLVKNPLFFLINSYTAGLSPLVAANMLDTLGTFSKISYGELALTFNSGKNFLPCGISVFGTTS